MLECPISSEFDSETKEAGKTNRYLRLIPLEYFKKSLEKEVLEGNETKNARVFYLTNNPNTFWQTP
jgi:hypothetical protein